MWVLIKSRKFMVSFWGVWELASPTEVVGVRRTWTFPCQVLISRMSFILKKGQFIPLAVVTAGRSQVLFCIVVYWWKGIWGPGNFICLFRWGFFCMITWGNQLVLLFFLILFYTCIIGCWTDQRRGLLLGTCTSSDISNGSHMKKKANKRSRHNPSLWYNYFLKGALMEYAF